MQVIKRYKKDNEEYRIVIDDCPINPREEYDNLGIIIHWHNDYNLGEEELPMENSFEKYEEVEKWLTEEKGAVIILPVYIYDHSGITIKTSPFNCRWDSGHIGYIYTTKENIEKFGVEISKVKEILEQEIKIFDDYLTGNVYMLEHVMHEKCDTCEHVEENIVDSCSYLGDIETSGILDDIPDDFEEVN